MSKKGQEAGAVQIRSASEEQHSQRLHLFSSAVSLTDGHKIPLKITVRIQIFCLWSLQEFPQVLAQITNFYY